ncbi:hypothetical protein AB0H36_26070 [Kribbella sp. NPDC050820]|uniref:hypothetical protein n=1 Tax=Kribbella sp. NPDC050820 TaxID=3155408 RepID=UPI0034031CDA
MSELRRGVGKDVCGRVHAITGVECYLPDTHYPNPHHSIEGDSWHDGLCSRCAGGGTDTDADAVCPRCNGTAFEPVALIDPETYQPG